MGRSRLNRLVLAHLLTVVGEWAVTFGVLVHAFRWGGSRAVGPVSLAVLASAFVGAPIAANLTARHRPHAVRVAGVVVQTVAFGGAAVTSALDLPTPAVAACVVLGLGAMNTLRPTGAALLPVIARSTDGMVATNLRISYCDSSSALVGSLLAAALTGRGGSTPVFVAGVVGSGIALAVTAWRPTPLELSRAGTTATERPRRVMRVAMAELRDRPWAVGVLAVSSARNLVIGAFDVLLVILALSALDLGDRGPGLLSALVGGGALVSSAALAVAVRRSQLRQALVGALAATAAMCIAIGIAAESAAVFVLLPVAGLSLSLIDNLSRMLLQRSTEPRRLGPLLACMGLVAGAGQLAGSMIAQALLAVAGVRVALVGFGVVLVVIGITTVRALREADAHADIPVVEMSILANVPMFAPLPTPTLEMAARAAEHVSVLPGDEVIRQGDEGDVFYVVVDGAFDIVMNGVLLRTARPSAPDGFFGEVALLSDMRRTATVQARGPGELLAIHREPFLVAITGHESASATAMDYIAELDLEEKMRRTRRLADD